MLKDALTYPELVHFIYLHLVAPLQKVEFYVIRLAYSRLFWDAHWMSWYWCYTFDRGARQCSQTERVRQKRFMSAWTCGDTLVNNDRKPSRKTRDVSTTASCLRFLSHGGSSESRFRSSFRMDRRETVSTTRMRITAFRCWPLFCGCMRRLKVICNNNNNNNDSEFIIDVLARGDGAWFV